MTRLAALALALAATPAAAQSADPGHGTPDTTRARYQAFDAAGAPLPLDAVLGRALDHDVVFVGEIHDDPTAHALEFAILAGLHARAGTREVVLALEMFEADVQTVLNEYLGGLVSERDFLDAARPWQNYADYRPLVEFAKANRLRVVASNAPVRYVRAVARGASFDDLFTVALPPLPVVPASPALVAAFGEAMGGMGGHGGPSMDGMVAAQNLRDASMAYQTSQVLLGAARPLVVHVNGAFHTAGGRGIPEHLARYRPGTRIFRIDVAPAADVDVPPAGIDADAVIQTPAALVPSRNGG